MERKVPLPYRDKRIALLERVPLFSGLVADEYTQLAGALREQHYRKNAVMFHTNDPGNALFLLTAGLAQMSVTMSDERELVLGLLYPGDFFGEMALLDRLPRSATVTTMEPSTALLLEQEAFVDLLQRTPSLARKTAEALSRRLRKACDLVHSLAFLDAHGKVARVVFTLAREKGRVTDQGTVVKIRLTQQAIAKQAGLTRETTAHVLRDLQQAGYIHLSREAIVVLEQSILARMAQA
jgi:CRP/FNR family cyclic AMP-dependent transcriptional regulator